MKEKPISTTRLAQICGVSQGTVDRALNNRKGINPKTREHILAVAKEYGYRPNIHARSMAGGKSMLIGVVVFDLYNPFFSDMLMRIEEAAAEQGYASVVMFTDKNSKKEIANIRELEHMAVDGIIVMPANSGTEYERFLTSLEIPIVTVGNRLAQFPAAWINDRAAMETVMEHVLRKDYEKLIYVTPNLQEKNSFAQQQRRCAFVEMAGNIPHIVTELSGVEVELAGGQKSAVICPADIYAMRLLETVKKYRAGIISFDNISLLDTLGIPLDSVAYDIQRIAQLAVDYIANGTPIDTTADYQLILRGSV